MATEKEQNQEAATETTEKELPYGLAKGRLTDDFCKKCGGECCKHFVIVSRPGELMAGLLSVHFGCEVEAVRFHINHTCPHLTEEGLCALWNEDPELDRRPAFCQNWLCDRAKKKMINIEAGDVAVR